MTQPYNDFPSTQSDIVFLAGHGDLTERRKAHDELFRRYWAPLHVYARRRGYSADRASDLTQGFLAFMHEKGEVRRVDPERHSFRPWLRRCFSNYLSNAREHERAWRRGGRALHVEYDSAEAARYDGLTARAATPDVAFEQTRALVVLDRAFEALRAEWTRKGRARWFDALHGFVTYEDERRYAKLAVELDQSVDTIRSEVCRLRLKHRELLCSEVARDTPCPESVTEELRSLLLAFTELRNPPFEPA